RRDRAVYLVTGPPAAGKTTVARLLAARFARGAHVEGDYFRRAVVTGREEMTPDASPAALRQLRLRYRIAASAADAYAAAGFTVALDDVVAGPLLRTMVRSIATRPLHVVVLLPSQATLAARATARGASGYTHFTVGQLHELFSSGTPAIGLWLDNGTQSPDETVDEILTRTGRR
ncbi:MAG: AAA family ATPase, partial [Chloroflexota bacterium]|nr:AAA family ATPase [Chloroflexota bacterium]